MFRDPPTITVTGLMRELQIPRARLTRTITHLVKEKLITREKQNLMLFHPGETVIVPSQRLFQTAAELRVAPRPVASVPPHMVSLLRMHRLAEVTEDAAGEMLRAYWSGVGAPGEEIVPLTRAPCTGCPYFATCRPGSFFSPEACPYLAEWARAPAAADKAARK